jgi:hypothetical protein
MNTVIVKCHACGCAQRETPTLGKVNPIAVQHESTCPFLLAIERGPAAAREWVEAHGYPISYEEAS